MKQLLNALREKRKFIILDAAVLLFIAGTVFFLSAVSPAPEKKTAVFAEYENPLARKEQTDREAAELDRQSFPGVLKKGMTGLAVKNLNNRLMELGFLKNEQDGSFTDATLEAVKAFQAENGLKTDGIVGELTFIELFRRN